MNPGRKIFRTGKSPSPRSRFFRSVVLGAIFGLGTVRLPAAVVFVRGEVNDDGLVNIADAVGVLNYLFLGSAAPRCLKAADTDDDGAINLTDAVYLLGYLFLGGPPPPPPHPSAGDDPTADDLPCPPQTGTEIRVEPAQLTLPQIGATLQLHVSVKIGEVFVDRTQGDLGTTYTSNDPHIALPYRDGLVEAQGVGSSTLKITHGDLEAVIPVTVQTNGASSSHRVLAANDLGMHCMDREFGVFSILPPYNVLRAQVVERRTGAKPRLLDESAVHLTYSAVADPAGSMSSASSDRTNFWEHAGGLFGAALLPGQGLTGLYMPDEGPSPGPQSFPTHNPGGWFEAAGIPITPRDDAGAENAYPLLRVTAWSASTAKPLVHLDAVVPVSQEIDCRGCHATGQIAASAGFVRWSRAEDVEIQTKQNILILHDYRSGTELLRSQPVLCAGCHYSPALDLAGAGPSEEQAKHHLLSPAMHGFHGIQTDGNGTSLFPPGAPPEETCYKCHPGKITRCQRGAMRTGGMVCSSCHSEMLQVAGSRPLLPGGSLDGTNDGQPRRPWKDLPRCQSCHTGDVLNHLSGADYVAAGDGIRLKQAFKVGDDSASPILAASSRFAEEPRTLYRFSKGHGGVLCQGCHGSTHAEWPNDEAGHNDNLATAQLQGHAGVLVECKTCHDTNALALGLNGPHGLHLVADLRWIDENHGDFYERSRDSCRVCHGANLEGSPLSRAAADRTFRVEDGTVRIPAGKQVSCDLCHNKPR